MASSGYCKILIVDDEILIRQGIKHFMNWEQEGFLIVGEASNGREALERIQEVRPHIVLTDIVMPVMDGEELTKEIKARYPEIEVIVLSSFGEFNYVRSTFQSGVADYILKPKLDIQHLLAVLKLTAQRIPALQGGEAGGARGVSVDRLLEGLLGGFESECRPEDVQAAFPYPRFSLAGGLARELEGETPAFGAGGSNPAASAESRLLGAISVAGGEARYYALPRQGGVAAVLANGDEAAVAALHRRVREIAKETFGSEGSRHDGGEGSLPESDSAPQASVSSGIAQPRSLAPLALSREFGGIGELRAVYRESLEKLLNYAFYLPDIRVLVAEELPEPGPAPEPFNLNRFTEDFKRGQFAEAFRELRRHASAMAACYTTDVFEFKTFLGNLIFNITVLLGNMGYGIKELDRDKYRYFKGIEQSRSSREALDCLESYIAEAERCIAGKTADAGNENMRKLLQYIQDHYAEPLTLSDMAKHFHFNPSYLSSYFSTHNEEGFVDYLHKVRIGKAEELLRGGDDPISEISGLVGYSDHSYFCKVFKKGTGLSPSHYRRQYRGQEKRGT